VKSTCIKLVGKTRHGKNRIHQHGEKWIVESVGKFQGQSAFSLRSTEKTEGPKHNKGFDGRWVLMKDDPNFWVKCDADAMQRICDTTNIPKDWLTR
jgi:hypothetical protein